MALKISKRGTIPAFIVMDVMQAAAEREVQKRAVFHMEVGQPGTPAPSKVIETAKAALDNNRLGYTVAMGLPELRHRISLHYKELYECDVDPVELAACTAQCGSAFDRNQCWKPTIIHVDTKLLCRHEISVST